MNYFKDGIHTNEDGSIEYDMNYFRAKTNLNLYLESKVVHSKK